MTMALAHLHQKGQLLYKLKKVDSTIIATRF